MKNFLKKTEGFTLVELIVVIAILGILAGVAIPAYSGYMKKANEAADTAALSAVKTAAVAACATVGEVDRIDVTETEVKIYVGDASTADYTLTYDATTDKKWEDSEADDVDVDFNAYMNSMQIDLKYYASAKWYAEADSTNNIAAGWTGSTT